MSMLCQLTATVNGIKFIALVCTQYADPEGTLPANLHKTLYTHYWKLENQLMNHRLKGGSARFTYPGTTIAIGFKRFEATRIFTDWKSERWFAHLEEGVWLIDSVMERGSCPGGRNIFEDLKPIRRNLVHPLLMVKIPAEIMDPDKNTAVKR